jgi:hypothetical protein
MVHHMTKLARIGAITIDCDDTEAMRSFYAAALDGEEVPGFPQTVRVGEMLLNFRELHDWIRPSWPGGNMQMHLEVLVPVGQLATQGSRLVSLRAEKSAHQDSTDPGLVVMLDPAGHPLRVFEDPFAEATASC